MEYAYNIVIFIMNGVCYVVRHFVDFHLISMYMYYTRMMVLTLRALEKGGDVWRHRSTVLMGSEWALWSLNSAR